MNSFSRFSTFLPESIELGQFNKNSSKKPTTRTKNNTMTFDAVLKYNTNSSSLISYNNDFMYIILQKTNLKEKPKALFKVIVLDNFQFSKNNLTGFHSDGYYSTGNYSTSKTESYILRIAYCFSVISSLYTNKQNEIGINRQSKGLSIANALLKFDRMCRDPYQLDCLKRDHNIPPNFTRHVFDNLLLNSVTHGTSLLWFIYVIKDRLQIQQLYEMNKLNSTAEPTTEPTTDIISIMDHQNSILIKHILKHISLNARPDKKVFNAFFRLFYNNWIYSSSLVYKMISIWITELSLGKFPAHNIRKLPVVQDADKLNDIIDYKRYFNWLISHKQHKKASKLFQNKYAYFNFNRKDFKSLAVSFAKRRCVYIAINYFDKYGCLPDKFTARTIVIWINKLAQKRKDYNTNNIDRDFREKLIKQPKSDDHLFNREKILLKAASGRLTIVNNNKTSISKLINDMQIWYQKLAENQKGKPQVILPKANRKRGGKRNRHRANILSLGYSSMKQTIPFLHDLFWHDGANYLSTNAPIDINREGKQLVHHLLQFSELQLLNIGKYLKITSAILNTKINAKIEYYEL